MTPPIQLYFWPTPNGKKISIALEEMEIPYQLHPVDIGKGDQFKPDFLKISPNNRMPAIVDPVGDDGRPLSVFESGAILQHLGRMSGRFYPQSPRERADVEQWLFWQVGGLGPMAGQANHFRHYAKKLTDESQCAYAADRYTNEVNRLYGVLERGLADGRDFIAGDFSIADMAIFPWVTPERHGQSLDGVPRMKAWRARVGARPRVRRGLEVGKDLTLNVAGDSTSDAEARKILFGQRARA